MENAIASNGDAVRRKTRRKELFAEIRKGAKRLTVCIFDSFHGNT
jgi:hypothetical protein